MNKLISAIAVIVLVGLGAWYYSGNRPAQNQNQAGTSAPQTAQNDVAQNEMPPVLVGATKEFTVTGGKFYLSPKTIMVNEGDRVKITFKNVDGFHDLLIEGFNAGTKQMQSPAEESFEFTADKTGSFEYYCSVGNHRAMGMKGTLVVK